MTSRVRYRKEWEREFPRTALGRARFGAIADRLRSATASELRRTGLIDDPPAREYLAELDTAPTDRGARVFTTASRAHFVEWGTAHRSPDAPMRTAASRFGRFTEGRGR
jgi:hypothetical protein